MTPTQTRPRLASKARLRFDRKSGRHMLLYPERGLVLNPTATDIVRLCTGEHTVDEIVDRLTARYGSEPREVIEAQVRDFLRSMAERGLVHDG